MSNHTYFKCSCGAVFDEFAKGYTGVEYAGVRETEGVCPACGDTEVDEGYKCDLCDEWFDGTNSTVLCDACRKEVATLDLAAKYGESISDGELNRLLLYIAESEYGIARLNEMLFKRIKEDNSLYKQYNLDDDFATKYIQDFLSDDYSSFDDWYMEEVYGKKV